MLICIACEHLKDDAEAAEDLIDELHGQWKGIYKVIGVNPVPGSEILRFGVTLLQAEERARTLSDDDALDYFRQQGKLQARKTAEISKWLLDVTKTVVPIYENTRLEAVAEINQARLLLVALLITDTLTDERRKKTLRQWENVTFRAYPLFGNDSKNAIGEFSRLAQRIVGKKQSANTYAKIMTELRAIGEKYPVRQAVEIFRVKTNAYNGWEENLRYFLFRYEEDVAARDGAQVSDELWKQIWTDSAARSIEHIAPQEFSTAWGDSESTYDAEYAPLVHCVGNLILVPPGINSQAARKSFKEKKDSHVGVGCTGLENLSTYVPLGATG